MRYDNYLWDFDGTLFDTYPRMAESLGEALRRQGVDAAYDVIMGRIKLSMGRAVAYFRDEYGIDGDALALDYHSIEHAMPQDAMRPYPGAAEALTRMAAQGGRHYLYTHRDESAISALRRCGMLSLFAGFVTANDAFPPKPAPDAIEHILARGHIEPGSAVMVGDRDIDILAARNAGIAGCLFDPEHFYDAFDTPLRAYSFVDLCRVMEVK